jgi:uncharacterized protein YjbI with pentapeptide repeats
MKSSVFTFVSLFVLFFGISVYADYPDQPFIDYISANNKKVKLEDGVDISDKRLSNIPTLNHHIQISRHGGTLKDVNFSRCYLYDADFRETNFENCNFSNTRLDKAYFEGTLTGCNFTGAIIGRSVINSLNVEQLKSTASYKEKNLCGIHFGQTDFSGADFSEINLSCASFSRVRLGKCNFSNAKIKGVKFKNLHTKETKDFDFRIEQLLVSKDFKEGFVDGVEVTQIIWSENYVVNLSEMVFVNCVLGSENQAKIDLTNSVISNCDFSNLKGLTLENVKSTWNYKHNRMEGIKLPKEIQLTN